MIVQLWGRVLVPPQGTHITISLIPFIELKPNNGRCQHSPHGRRPLEASLIEPQKLIKKINYSHPNLIYNFALELLL